MRTMLFCLSSMFLMFVVCRSPNAAAAQVLPSTRVTVVRPSIFDAMTCDKVVFDDAIGSLTDVPSSTNFATSRFDSTVINPAGNRSALVIEVFQQGLIMPSMRIEGDRSVLTEIETKLAQGTAIKLTEYNKCVQSDQSLTFVELVTFNPTLKNVTIDLAAKIEVIRKSDQGVCAVMFSKSLSEIVKMYNPSANVSTLKAQVTVFSHGVTPDGELSTKRIYISFKDQSQVFGNTLSRPTISIVTLADLSYAAIDKLSLSTGILQMTSVRDCMGERPDDPLWIQDAQIR